MPFLLFVRFRFCTVFLLRFRWSTSLTVSPWAPTPSARLEPTAEATSAR